MEKKYGTPTELTHEEYIEELETLGIDTSSETMPDFEMKMSVESVNAVADQFIAFGDIISGGSFSEMAEMHQKLEPKHARSQKRYMAHKRAVERRRKRKRGGKK